MKRIILRITALSLLVMATLWLGILSHAYECASNMFAQNTVCDGTFVGSINGYSEHVNNWPNNCKNQAQAECDEYQDPADRAQCEYESYANCHNSIVGAYNNRYSTYGDCLGQAEVCSYQPDYCPEAYARKDACTAIYLEFNDYSAYETCIMAIPHRSNCPAFFF